MSCEVKAQVLRMWLFLWHIWISASCLDQTYSKEVRLHEAEVKEMNVNVTCLVSTADFRGALFKSDVCSVFLFGGWKRVRRLLQGERKK